MEIKALVEKLHNIESIKEIKVNFGVGPENNISFEVNDEQLYSNWSWFCKNVNKDAPEILITKRWPKITFVFPRHEKQRDGAIEEFNAILDKKYYLIPEPKEQYFTIICKVTNLCNIDCQYCYDKPFRKLLGHNGFLTFEKLDKLLDMATRHAKEVTWIWHGGEPTLAGKEFYRKFYEELLPKYPYANIGFNLQTNGSLLDKEWFELAKKYGVGIGSSYSATAEELRHTLDDNESKVEGHGIYNVLDNLKIGKEIGMTSGVIDVLTKENHPRVIQAYEFYKKTGITCCFNEIHKAGEATGHDFLYTTGQDMKKYLEDTVEYFVYWLNDKDPRCYDDRYAAQYLKLLGTTITDTCNFSGDCVDHWIGINSNGDIYPCDRALPEKYRTGNITQFDSISDIYNSEAYTRFRNERNAKLEKYCHKCKYFRFCHGGCPMKDIDDAVDASIPNKYACTMLRLNLLAMYKALHKTSIDKCNRFAKRIIVENAIILPKEIPNLMKEIGLKDEIKGYKFTFTNANFGTKEWDLFQTINDKTIQDRCRCEIWEEGMETYPDDRLVRVIKALADNAADIEKNEFKFNEHGEPFIDKHVNCFS